MWGLEQFSKTAFDSFGNRLCGGGFPGGMALPVVLPSGGFGFQARKCRIGGKDMEFRGTALILRSVVRAVLAVLIFSFCAQAGLDDQSAALLVSNRNPETNIHISLRVDKPFARAGEAITITAETDRDCRLRILYLDHSGRVSVIWPSGEPELNGRVQAFRRIAVPEPGSGFKFVLDGRDPIERFVAYATTEKDAILTERDFKPASAKGLREFIGGYRELRNVFVRRTAELPRHVRWGTAQLTVQVGPAGSGAPPATVLDEPFDLTGPPTRRIVLYKDEYGRPVSLGTMATKKIIDYPDRQVITLEEPRRFAGNFFGRDSQVLPADDLNRILLRCGHIDTQARMPSVPKSLEIRPTPGKQLFIVQFPGPIKQEWLERLKTDCGRGVRLLSYIPNNAYLIWTDERSRFALKGMTTGSELLQWTGPFHPAYKIDPVLVEAAERDTFSDWSYGRDFLGEEHDSAGFLSKRFRQIEKELSSEYSGRTVQRVSIQLVDHPGVYESLRMVQSKAVSILDGPWTVGPCRNIAVEVEKKALAGIAALQDVVSIENYPESEFFGERQAMIAAGFLMPSGDRPSGPGYLRWLARTNIGKEFDFVIDVMDSGFDRGHISGAEVHEDFFDDTGKSRLKYAQTVKDGQVITSPASALADGLGHGTHVAGILVGLNNRGLKPVKDSEGYQYGLGLAPYALIGASKVILGNRGVADALKLLVPAAYGNGARISNNSWGAMKPTSSYGTYSKFFDIAIRDAQPAIPGNQEYVVVFSAGNSGPKKKSIGDFGSTAKNTLVVGNSESWFYPRQFKDSDDVRDIAQDSSRGPTQDGRFKPDLVAPGTQIVAAASGVPDMEFKKYYFPRGQKRYLSLRGTSMAAPAVTGAAALIRRSFETRRIPAPSPAMTKALLMNSTTYMTGNGANDDLPSNNQGMGRLNLGMALDGTPRLLVDQTKVFDNTGATFVVQGRIADPGKPFRVTLAWTDAPGAAFSAPWVNNLDLEVKVNGQLYRGNNFKKDKSQRGGKPDTRNNVESVWLPAGTTGDFVVTVRAGNIAGDGIPHQGDVTDQDFALVVYNATQNR